MVDPFYFFLYSTKNYLTFFSENKSNNLFSNLSNQKFVSFFSCERAMSVLKNSDSPQKVIVELCRHFYHQGWVSGTGGGKTKTKNKKFNFKKKVFLSELKMKFLLHLPEFINQFMIQILQ